MGRDTRGRIAEHMPRQTRPKRCAVAVRVLDELLEECYSKGEEEFLSFTERFGTGKNDRKIEGIILKLYEYSGSYPRPEQWLDRCAAVYTEEEAAEAMIGTQLDDATLDVLASVASAAAKPIDDKRGTISFRKDVCGVLARRAAKIAYSRAKGAST